MVAIANMVHAMGMDPEMSRLVAIIGAGLLLAGTPACKHEIETDAIDSLVAPRHQYKLRFESREITSGLKHRARYTVAVPRGWKGEFGTFRPDDEQIFGGSWMKVRTSCEECRLGTAKDFPCAIDECIPQDWSRIIEKRIAESGRNFIRNDTTNGRRVVISRGPDVGSVDVYWWSEGAPVYHVCEAWLDEQLVDSAFAFAKACELAVAH